MLALRAAIPTIFSPRAPRAPTGGRGTLVRNVTRLVVGLGNPGPEYEWTPHNLGFHALDELARRHRLIFETPAAFGPQFTSLPARLARDTRRDALLVKPVTYMNRSGVAIAPLARALAVPPEQILVVYDDLDLPPGALRLRPHGGSGGHNGVRSMSESLGSDSFPRLRIGIGRPRTDAARHVLTQLEGAARTDAEIAVAHAADALDAWLDTGDLPGVMTRFHSRWKDLGSQDT